MRADAHGALADRGDAVMTWPPTTNFQRPVFCILGLPFDAITVDGAVGLIAKAAAERKRCFLSTPNLKFVIGSRDDAQFRESVLQSDLSVADGMPLIWVARALGLPLHERVAGSSIFERLRRSQRRPLRTYLFGGPEGAAAKACAALNATPTGIVCAGFDSPGYGTVDELSSDAIVDAINASNADFLLVALGAQKGQRWIVANLDRLNAPVVGHLGAVINFVAGTVSRAPTRWQRLGLEWFWRIRQEPLLWQRYANDGARFLWLLAKNVTLAMIDARRHGPSVADLAGASVQVAKEGAATLITIGGDWTVDNLQALRTTYGEAVRSSSDIVVDVGRLGYFESAWVALLLLLRGHQGKVDRSLRLRSVSSTTRRRLAIHGVDYLDLTG